MLAGLLLVLLVLLIALVWDWNWFKPMVERHVQAATGRDFAISGDLDVDLGFPATVRVEGVKLANADWSATGADMLRVGRAEIAVRLWPLLRGRFDLPVVRVDQGHLLLERSDDGVANWQFGNRSDATSPVVIRNLEITEGTLQLIEPGLRTDLGMDLRTGAVDADSERAPLLAEGAGRYRGEAFALAGRVDSPLDLQDGERPYRIDLRASAGSTRARVYGELAAPLQLDDFSVRFELAGADLAQLYPLLGIALPATPPYALDGRLGRSGSIWRYEDLTGTIGDSDLRGDAGIDPGRERPMLTAVLASDRLDLDDLAGFLGATPGTGENETASPAQVAQARRRQGSGRLLPDTDYDLSKLRSIDADVTLTADAVNAPPLPVRSLAGRLVLDAGVARIDALRLGVAGGEVTGWLTMDATRDPIATSLKLNARGLDLPRLFPDAELVRDSAGRIAGDAQLDGRGNSLAAMLASADGTLGLAMGPGRISNLLIELAGLDIAEAIGFLLTDDEVIPVRCAYADFAFDDGVATARSFAVDTSDTVIFGEGRVDFSDESLDIVLRPRPKDRSILALRTPLRIGGSLADPSFRPEGGPLLLRGIAAAALYAAAPPATLLALIEFGPGEDADCGPERAGPGRD